MRRRNGAALFTLVFAVALAACGGGETKTVTVTTEKEPAVDTTTTESVEPSGELTAAKGEPLKLGEFTVTLGGSLSQTTVAREGDKPLKANGIFQLFELTIKNTSKRPLNWGDQLDGRLELTDGKNIYAHNGGEAAFWISAQQKGDSGASTLDPIQPGETSSQLVGFDVPKDVPARLNGPEAAILIVDTETLNEGQTPSTASKHGTLLLGR